MSDEFDELMEYFSGSQEDREGKLDDIFQSSMYFFERYKNVLKEGTEEEKKAMQKKMDALRARFSSEAEQSREKLGVSRDEVKQIAQDQTHFSSSQWELIQRAQKTISESKEQIDSNLQERKERRLKEIRKKKKKSRATKSNWMKS